MPTFDVYVEHTAKYTVEAATADEAAQILEEGGNDPEWLDATVDTVVPANADRFDVDDMREPVDCRECGDTQPPGSPNPCTTCFLASLPRRAEVQ